MLRKLWHKWIEIAQKIGNFQARVLLSVFYFLFVSCIGIIVRLVSDPLKLKRPKMTPYWVQRQPKVMNLEEAGRQF